MFTYQEDKKCHICKRKLKGIQFYDRYGFRFYGAKITRTPDCFLTYADADNNLHEVCPECFNILENHMEEDPKSGYQKLKHTIRQKNNKNAKR